MSTVVETETSTASTNDTSNSRPTTSTSTPSSESSSHTTKKSIAKPCKPQQQDVLCGYGQQYGKHEGNIFYRSLIHKYTTQYKQSKNKDIVHFIIDQVEQKGGKWLKKGENNLWYPLSKDSTISRIENALFYNRHFQNRRIVVNLISYN